MDTVFTSRNKIRLILLALVMAILVGLGAIVLHDLLIFFGKTFYTPCQRCNVAALFWFLVC